MVRWVGLIRLGHYIDGSSQFFVKKWKKPLKIQGVHCNVDSNEQPLWTYINNPRTLFVDS